MIEMNFEDWLKKYEPEKNLLAENRPYENLMFETFGNERFYVIDMNNANPCKVWTLLEEDDTLWISSGFHYINRLGYFITKKPFHSTEDIEIILAEPDPEYSEEE